VFHLDLDEHIVFHFSLGSQCQFCLSYQLQRAQKCSANNIEAATIAKKLQTNSTSKVKHLINTMKIMSAIDIKPVTKLSKSKNYHLL